MPVWSPSLYQRLPIYRDKLKREISKLECKLADGATAAESCALLVKEVAQSKAELTAMQQDLADWPNAW